MTTDLLLLSLPILLENQPKLFSEADLQNLQQTLTFLEHDPPENAERMLKEWCKARRPIRDALRDLENHEKELKKVKPTQANQTMRTTNFFQELSQQVKDKLNSKSKNPDSSQSNV